MRFTHRFLFSTFDYCFLFIVITAIVLSFFNFTPLLLLLIILAIDIITAIIITYIREKKYHSEPITKINTYCNQNKQKDRYISILEYLYNNYTNHNEYALTRKTLIAEIKSELSLINISTMISIVIAILISVDFIPSEYPFDIIKYVLWFILILATGSVTCFIQRKILSYSLYWKSFLKNLMTL